MPHGWPKKLSTGILNGWWILESEVDRQGLLQPCGGFGLILGSYRSPNLAPWKVYDPVFWWCPWLDIGKQAQPWSPPWFGSNEITTCVAHANSCTNHHVAIILLTSLNTLLSDLLFLKYDHLVSDSTTREKKYDHRSWDSEKVTGILDQSKLANWSISVVHDVTT